MSSLEEIRKKIDHINEQILKLLNERAELNLQIKKTEAGQTPIRPERESQIIKDLIAKNPGPLPNEAVQQIFKQIIASLRDTLQLDKPVSVAYLGPKGTYSQEAAEKLFGSTINLEAEESIAGVFRAVEAGTTQLAVVPIENSSEGAIRETHRLLLETNSSIVSEITIPVVHCLLSKSENLSEISEIYAHPQALGQCRTWLATHLPNAKIIPAASNSAAAASAASAKNSAAIASKNAADQYELTILEAGINDQPGNETRFIALGKLPTKQTGSDKTSMICILNDKPGALYELLGVLAEKKISMTRLESQPYQKNQYAFYIDFEGHKDDENVKDCLDQIDQMTRVCKVLGSYSAEIRNE